MEEEVAQGRQDQKSTDTKQPFDVPEQGRRFENNQQLDDAEKGNQNTTVSDEDIVRIIRSTGCSHIQEVLKGMDNDDIIGLVRSGKLDEVLLTIQTGTIEGYEAASKEPDALDVIQRLLSQQNKNKHEGIEPELKNRRRPIPPGYRQAQLPKDISPAVIVQELDASTKQVRARGQILQAEDGSKILHIETIKNYGSEKDIGRKARKRLLSEAIAHGATRITSEVTSAAMAHTYGDLFGKDRVFRTIDGRQLTPDEAAQEINKGTVRIVYLDAPIPQDIIKEGELDIKTQRQILELFDWATEHIPKPCGQTDEEKNAQRNAHQEAVLEALAEPSIYENLNPTQKEILAKLLDPNFRGYPTPEEHNLEQAIKNLDERIQELRAKNKAKRATTQKDNNQKTDEPPKLGEHIHVVIEEEISAEKGTINVLTRNYNEGQWPDPTDETKTTDLATFMDIILASQGLPSAEALRRQGIKLRAAFVPTKSEDEGGHDVPGILEITWEENKENEEGEGDSAQASISGAKARPANKPPPNEELSPQDQALLERLLLSDKGNPADAKGQPSAQKDKDNDEGNPETTTANKPKPKNPNNQGGKSPMSSDDRALLENLLGIQAPSSETTQNTNFEQLPPWLENLERAVNRYAEVEAAKLYQDLIRNRYAREGTYVPELHFARDSELTLLRTQGHISIERQQWIKAAKQAGIDPQNGKFIVTPNGVLGNPDRMFLEQFFYLNEKHPLASPALLWLDVAINAETLNYFDDKFSDMDLMNKNRYLRILARRLNINESEIEAYLNEKDKRKRVGIISTKSGIKTRSEQNWTVVPKPQYNEEIEPPPKGIVELPANAELDELDDITNLYFDQRRINALIDAGISVKYVNPITGEITIFLAKNLADGESVPVGEKATLVKKGKRYEMHVTDNKTTQGTRFKVIQCSEIGKEERQNTIARTITRNVTPDTRELNAAELNQIGKEKVSRYARSRLIIRDTETPNTEEMPNTQNTTEQLPEKAKPDIPRWNIIARRNFEVQERINNIISGLTEADQEITGEPPLTEWEIEEAHNRKMDPWQLRRELGVPWELKTEEEKQAFMEEAWRRQDEYAEEKRRQQALSTKIGRVLTVADQIATIGWKGASIVGKGMAHRFFPPGGYQSEEQDSGDWDRRDWQEASGPFANYAEIFNQAEETSDAENNNNISDQVDTLLEVEAAVDELQEQVSEIAEASGIQEREIEQTLEEAETNLKDQRVPIRERIRQAMNILRRLSGHSRAQFDYSPLEEDYSNWNQYEGDNEDNTEQAQQESQGKAEEYTQQSQTQSNEEYYDYPPEYTGPPREDKEIRFNVANEERKPKKQKWTGMMSDLQMAFYTQEGRTLYKTNRDEAMRWLNVMNKVKAGKKLSEEELAVADRMVRTVREEERRIEEWERSQQNFSSYGRIRFDEEGRFTAD